MTAFKRWRKLFCRYFTLLYVYPFVFHSVKPTHQRHDLPFSFSSYPIFSISAHCRRIHLSPITTLPTCQRHSHSHSFYSHSRSFLSPFPSRPPPSTPPLPTYSLAVNCAAEIFAINLSFQTDTLAPNTLLVFLIIDYS